MSLFSSSDSDAAFDISGLPLSSAGFSHFFLNSMAFDLGEESLDDKFSLKRKYFFQILEKIFEVVNFFAHHIWAK